MACDRKFTITSGLYFQIAKLAFGQGIIVPSKLAYCSHTHVPILYIYPQVCASMQCTSCSKGQNIDRFVIRTLTMQGGFLDCFSDGSGHQDVQCRNASSRSSWHEECMRKVDRCHFKLPYGQGVACRRCNRVRGPDQCDKKAAEEDIVSPKQVDTLLLPIAVPQQARYPLQHHPWEPSSRSAVSRAFVAKSDSLDRTWQHLSSECRIALASHSSTLSLQSQAWMLLIAMIPSILSVSVARLVRPKAGHD